MKRLPFPRWHFLCAFSFLKVSHDPCAATTTTVENPKKKIVCVGGYIARATIIHYARSALALVPSNPPFKATHVLLLALVTRSVPRSPFSLWKDSVKRQGSGYGITKKTKEKFHRIVFWYSHHNKKFIKHLLNILITPWLNMWIQKALSINLSERNYWQKI